MTGGKKKKNFFVTLVVMNIFVFQNYCNNDNMGIKKKI